MEMKKRENKEKKNQRESTKSDDKRFLEWFNAFIHSHRMHSHLQQ